MARNVIEVIVRGKDLVSPSLTKISSSLGKLQKSVFSLRSAFLALGVGFAGKNVKDLALFTANVDLLRLSMEQLARVNEINIKFLDATVTVMKSMGVATDDAIRSLISFIRLNLDLTKATKFVRVAQDLAVISQKTTSQVVEQLTRGITTLNARMLRSAGVFFTAQQAAKEWAKENNRTVVSMSVAEKQAAVLNKIIEDGEKVTGAYEASLSLAGKKVLQLDRLWKEARLAIGEFTQEGLMIGVESIQDFLKSIVLLRESGRLDEFGKSMTATLVTIIKTIKSLSKAVVSSGKLLFEWRKAILLIAKAFIAWKIISAVIGSIQSLSAALLTAEGSALIPFLVSVQTLTTELGLFGAAAISAATALTVFGTAVVGIGIGKLVGDMIAVSSAMEKLRDSFLESTAPQIVKDFVNEWFFGALLIRDLEKETTDLLSENIQKRIALRLKEAKKVQEELAAEEQLRRNVNNAQQELINTIDAILALRDKSLSKTEKEIRKIKELRGALLASVEVLKTIEPESIIDLEGIAADLAILDELLAEARKKQEEENEKARQKELQRVSEHGESLAQVMEARIELFTENARSSAAIMGDAIIAISGQIKSSIDETLFALITQSKNMEEIWTSLWKSMLKTVIAAVTQMIAQQLIMLIAQLVGIKTAAISETATNAAEIYGNSFASAAAIPEVGWAIAPQVAAANTALFLSSVGPVAAAGAGEGAGIAAFAEGGIVDRPTLALIGEAGPEAVIPLNRARGLEGNSPVIIEKMELFPNITDGEFLLNLPRTTLERWAREELIPVFDALDDRGIRPERNI